MDTDVLIGFEIYKKKDELSLIDWAYFKIKEMLFLQLIIPGQKLVCSDICDILNISRTPVINAFNRLTQEGYLTSKKNRGYYVKPVSTNEVEENFGIREALEVYSVEQFCFLSQPDGDEVKELEKKIERHRAYMPDAYNREKLYLDFCVHLHISTFSNNRLLHESLKNNLEKIYLRIALFNSSSLRMGEAADEHDLLLEYIKGGDVEAAKSTMGKHIRNSRDNILKTLNDASPDFSQGIKESG